jgi:hypothetical protein
MHHVDRAVPEWVFVLVDDPAPVIDGQALGGDGRAGDVAAQTFQAAPLMRLADTGSMRQLEHGLWPGLCLSLIHSRGVSPPGSRFYRVVNLISHNICIYFQ